MIKINSIIARTVQAFESRTAPPQGAEVRAVGTNGRKAGERHVVTRVLDHTVWTRLPDSLDSASEDFVTRDVFWDTFEPTEATVVAFRRRK